MIYMLFLLGLFDFEIRKTKNNILSSKLIKTNTKFTLFFLFYYYILQLFVWRHNHYLLLKVICFILLDFYLLQELMLTNFHGITIHLLIHFIRFFTFFDIYCFVIIKNLLLMIHFMFMKILGFR